MERITAIYLIETPLEPSAAAEVLAGEQSSGTFVEVPGETDALKQRFAARVESVDLLDTVSTPSLPGNPNLRGPFHRAVVKVSWSMDNFGYNLPVLLSTLQGNLFELKQFTGLKLMDITFPDAYCAHFHGPAFGIEGCRALTSVYDRPIIGTIIKPSVGLTPDETALVIGTLADAGIDFVKDDELMSSTANSPFEARLGAVMRVINKHADKTGRQVMYAVNITGDMDDMMERYDKVVASGGTCAMVSINSVGLSAVKKICARGQLAIHAHRNGWGMLTRHPMFGVDFRAYQKIWRLAGVDQIHVNGIQNKFWESDDSVVKSIEACLASMSGHTCAMPVVSSGQWGGQAFETYRRTRTVDLLYMAGGGIMAHPMGPSAGVRALQQAWHAAVEGSTLEDTMKRYPEFAASVEKFGRKHHG